MAPADPAARAASLLAFTHYLRRPDESIDLARAALVLAEGFQPGLDVAFHAGRIERIGDEARRRVAGLPAGSGDEARARRLLRLLYEEIGFRGNRAEYYDPRNSFLNEVLERRIGIPITLAVILIEVARQAGVAAEGVAFPGHFLVRLPSVGGGTGAGEGSGASAAGGLLIDPFEGCLLDDTGLQVLHERFIGGGERPDPSLLAPAGTKQILVRMLANLRSVYQSRGDREALRTTLERLAVLTPDDEGVAAALSALSPGPAPASPTLKN